MEWTFRDDGTILARAGSTGPKIDAGSAVSEGRSEGHMHNFTWRLDIDLNGAGANTAFWKSHSENLTAPSKGTDNREEIRNEASRVWNPEQFNTLEIQDARLRNKHLVDNGLGRRTSYELLPMRSGTARHSDPWTQADFWVTRYNPVQIHAFTAPMGQQLQPGQDFPLDSLPDFIRNGQPTTNQDLVIWYTGSEHHEKDSRDEEANTVPIIWTGFELDPQNVFDGTPFFP
jgi:Cu2+-containing amine oxidase